MTNVNTGVNTMDKEILKIISEKVKICSEWAGTYNPDLKRELLIIADQLNEVSK